MTADPIDTSAIPDRLRPGLPLPVIRHYRAEGFMDAEVMTVPAVPGVIIVRQHSS